VTQKAELLRQDLEIRNQIDTINKDIAVIDQKLYELINPTSEGLAQEGTSQTATVPTAQEIISQPIE